MPISTRITFPIVVPNRKPSHRQDIEEELVQFVEVLDAAAVEKGVI